MATARIGFISSAAAALAVWTGFASTVFAADPPAADAKKILVYTKSSGFQHSGVARGKDGELGLSEKILAEIGKKNGYAVDVTKDGAKITAENLKQYAAVVFYTQGDLTNAGVDMQPPMRKEDRPAILEYIKNGGGFLGTHCGGADTFHEWTDGKAKPFLDMVGGEFIGHGAQQGSSVELVDPKFPGVSAWPAAFTLTEEWYAYRGFQPNMRVLMMLNPAGMKEKMYERPPYPITWCSTYGKGRVYYTGFGHREDVWQNEKFQAQLAGAMKWTTGDVEADASPNLQSLFGSVEKGLERINPPAGQ
ncbi:MAG: ThuA domain-containing protein [Planctomycetia bacterium]